MFIEIAEITHLDPDRATLLLDKTGYRGISEAIHYLYDRNEENLIVHPFILT